MAVNTAKRLEKVQMIKDKMRGGGEPIVTSDAYVSQLTSALAWYNVNEDDKIKRKWLATYFTTQNQKQNIPLFNDMPDYEVRQLATLARLKARDQYISDEHLVWMSRKISELIVKYDANKAKAKAKEVDVAPTNVISIQDRIEDSARKHAAEFDAAIDEYVITKGKTTFSAKSYLAANEVSAPVAKRIGELFLGLSAELHETIAGADEQLVEGYSNFNKKQLKQFAEFVDTIIADCSQQVQTAKANRAPRKRKEVPVGKQVAKMKFLKDIPELGLKCASMTSIIGSSEVWFYNSKYRRIGVYKGIDGQTVSVKGTTIIGFDVKESKQWTLRKPEEFFKGLSMGKRALANAVKVIKTKPAVPNGRFNEETLLLGAF